MFLLCCLAYVKTMFGKWRICAVSNFRVSMDMNPPLILIAGLTKARKSGVGRILTRWLNAEALVELSDVFRATATDRSSLGSILRSLDGFRQSRGQSALAASVLDILPNDTKRQRPVLVFGLRSISDLVKCFILFEPFFAGGWFATGMVRGLERVDQLLMLTMAAYNLTRMRTPGKSRLQTG